MTSYFLIKASDYTDFRNFLYRLPPRYLFLYFDNDRSSFDLKLKICKFVTTDQDDKRRVFLYIVTFLCHVQYEIYYFLWHLHEIRLEWTEMFVISKETHTAFNVSSNTMSF